MIKTAVIQGDLGVNRKPICDFDEVMPY